MSLTVRLIDFVFDSFKRMLKRKGFDFNEKVCLITGGSSGLGYAIAEELIARGASVILVARNAHKLHECCNLLREISWKPSQRIIYYSCNVTNSEEVEKMFKELEVKPSVLFCCAGMSKPGNFLSQPLKDFESCMKLNYFGTLYSIKGFLSNDCNEERKIVMISSTAGLASFYGYSAYAPTKNALRSLADCLRDEIQVTSNGATSIHIYFSSTINTDGFTKEQQTKPYITKNIEGAEISNPSPKHRASVLLDGVERGYFHITSDLITDIFRATIIGISPRANYLYDLLLNLIGWLIIPFWRFYVDHYVINTK